MITQENKSSNLPSSWQATSLLILGAIFNILALVTKDSGGLVAVGCSLIAIGAQLKRKNSK